MTELDIRQQILEAAEKRFQVYGYNKTSMAEIASDCNMSAANLYRYFKNKLEICRVLAEFCLLEKENFLAEISVNEQLDTVEKFRAFVMGLLDYSYQNIEENPKLGELVEAITQQCPDVVEVHKANKAQLIVNILLEGQANGTFQIDDIEVATDGIQTALVLFYFPVTLQMYSYEQLKQKAQNLTDVLLNGLLTK
jgi:AcrR family transcriptional regulator